jgi:hypothetical protein
LQEENTEKDKKMPIYILEEKEQEYLKKEGL